MVRLPSAASEHRVAGIPNWSRMNQLHHRSVYEKFWWYPKGWSGHFRKMVVDDSKLYQVCQPIEFLNSVLTLIV
jgi:hypothetical protein